MNSAHFIPSEESLVFLDFIFSTSESSREKAWAGVEQILESGVLTGSLSQLLPLLYWRCNSANMHFDGEHDLRYLYLRTWENNEVAFSKFKDVKQALRIRGISFIPLKGYLLCRSYYPDPATRPMSDIDILVAPSEWEAAGAALGHIGYEPEFHPAALQNGRHALLFTDKLTRLSVDLHIQITQGGASYRLNDTIWEAAVQTYMDGGEETHLYQTDLLFSVLAHSLFFAIIPTTRWIPDSLFTISRNPTNVDWDRLSHFASETHLGRLMAKQLIFLKDRYEAAIPESVIAALSNQKLGWVERLGYSFTYRTSRYVLVNKLKKQAFHLLTGLQNLSRAKFGVRAEFVARHLINEIRKLLSAVLSRFSA